MPLDELPAPVLQPTPPPSRLPFWTTAGTFVAVPHRAFVHAAVRQVSGETHCLPSGDPHLPSASHTAETHWVLLEHGCEFAFLSVQRPGLLRVLQNCADLQSASFVHPVIAQVPALAVVEEQVLGDVQPLPPAPRQPSWHLFFSQTRPLVALPQSRSAVHSTHAPIVVVALVHFCGDAQVLPPVPRQPSTQVPLLLAPSHTRALVALPHWVSVLHPMHFNVARSHRPVRQMALVPQVSPLALPHLPSLLQTELVH